MSRCKVIWETEYHNLENSVNEFIADKQVIDISMTVDTSRNYYACIIYEEWSEW